jgi:hypothetical protein
LLIATMTLEDDMPAKRDHQGQMGDGQARRTLDADLDRLHEFTRECAGLSVRRSSRRQRRSRSRAESDAGTRHAKPAAT